MYVIPKQQHEQMWHTFTFLTEAFVKGYLCEWTTYDGSWIRKSVSCKREENSLFSTKPAPLKKKNDYSDKMWFVI